MKQQGFRYEFFFIFLVCTAVLATALFMEFSMGLEPCMLCMSQRFVYVAIAFVALLGVFHNPMLGGHKIYGRFVAFFALAGAALAVRQLYLQNLPEDRVPACGASFDYMIEAFPLTDVIVSMIVGSGSCAEVQFSLLGLSIPGWSLVAYLSLFFYALYLALCQTKIMLIND